jgi:acyl carrier protein
MWKRADLLMPTEAEIYGALTEIFQDVFMRDDLVLKPELTAKDVQGWDSFKQIEIIMATEEKFGIKMNTRELDSLQNVGDLVRVVAAKGG